MGKEIRFGVIGAAYMGKAYAIALSSVSTVFELPARAKLEMIATTDEKGAEKKAAAFGFARSTGDWRKLVTDPDVDIVGIGSPTYLHKEMALAAIAAGKPVLCERPLSLSAKDANDMALAAERAGVKTLVGFNYMKNPATQLAKQMIEAGEIGDIIHFRGTHNEDYLMDPALPMDWRLKAKYASRAGALGDLASHIVNLAHYLCSPIAEVVGESQTVHKARPAEGGVLEAVENDDQTNFLAKFASGALGSLEASRIAAGRKMGLTLRGDRHEGRAPLRPGAAVGIAVLLGRRRLQSARLSHAANRPRASRVRQFLHRGGARLRLQRHDRRRDEGRHSRRHRGQAFVADVPRRRAHRIRRRRRAALAGCAAPLGPAFRNRRGASRNDRSRRLRRRPHWLCARPQRQPGSRARG